MWRFIVIQYYVFVVDSFFFWQFLIYNQLVFHRAETGKLLIRINNTRKRSIIRVKKRITCLSNLNISNGLKLRQSDKSISYIGPKLYNKTASIINKDIKYVTTCLLEDKFLNSFKSTVNKYLLTAQAQEPKNKDWNNSNFVLLEI